MRKRENRAGGVGGVNEVKGAMKRLKGRECEVKREARMGECKRETVTGVEV